MAFHAAALLADVHQLASAFACSSLFLPKSCSVRLLLIITSTSISKTNTHGVSGWGLDGFRIYGLRFVGTSGSPSLACASTLLRIFIFAIRDICNFLIPGWGRLLIEDL